MLGLSNCGCRPSISCESLRNGVAGLSKSYLTPDLMVFGLQGFPYIRTTTILEPVETSADPPWKSDRMQPLPARILCLVSKEGSRWGVLRSNQIVRYRNLPARQRDRKAR